MGNMEMKKVRTLITIAAMLFGSAVAAQTVPPVLAPIGAQSVTEGASLVVPISATDGDVTIPVLTTSLLPLNATFVDNLDGTGTFTFNPDFTQAGSVNVTFYATDAVTPADVDSEAVTITINEAGNQTPVLAAIGAQSTTENVLLSFSVSATDADATTPTLTTSALPSGAVFTDNGNGTGSFSWTPGFTQAGSYPVVFRATDAGLAVDSESVTITVTDAGNQTPVLAAIGAQSTTENVLLSFSVSATDADATTPTLTTSTLPSGAVFTDNGNGTGSFSWTPGFTQAGSYPVVFRATDAGLAVDSESVTITVTDAGNQTPVLAAIGPRSTTENVLLSFSVSATDADATTPTLTTSTLPSGAVFTDNGNGTGSFSWTPGFTQAGSYPVVFRATDAGLAVDSESVTITVTDAGNQTPVLTSIGPRSTTENVLLLFSVSATDADATTPTLTTSALPSGAVFTDNGNGTGSFSWTPGFTQAGSYPVVFRATDASLAVDSESVTITVNEAGANPPVLASIGSRNVNEGLVLSFGVSATDADLAIPVLSATNLPPNASFVDNLNGTGQFTFSPNFTQGGIYLVTFFANDAVTPDVDSEVVIINVANINQPPVLAAIGARSVTEGNLLTVSVSASDGDGTTAVLTTSTLPLGAGFTDNGNGTGALTWTPGFLDAGVYSVTFRAADDSSAIDSEVVAITIVEAGNQTPVLAAIGPKSATENVLLTFSVSATDAESTPTLSTSTLPAGASFIDNGNGTGSFSWTPGFTQAGSYPIVFRASDAGLAVDSEAVTITVSDAGNQLPVLAAIGTKVGSEGALLSFGVSATDAESVPTFTTSTLPLGASFTDNGNGTGSFSWTPGFTQSGNYSITFRAIDAALAVDSEVVLMVIPDQGNVAPTITAVSDFTVNENDSIVLTVTASDPDGGGIFPSMSINTTLSNYTFIDNGNGTGSFKYKPNFSDAGIDTVRFLATDFGSPRQSAQEISVITTADVNQPPTIDLIGPFGVKIGDSLIFVVTARDVTDASGLRIFMTASGLPAGATYIDNLNSTATFRFKPIAGQTGDYNITFFATDQGSPQYTTTRTVLVKVIAVNQPPVLANIGPRQVLEGNTLNINLSATDTDGPFALQLQASGMPNNSSILDNGNGTGVFTFTPAFTQAGLHSVTIRAYDGAAIDKEVVLIQVLEAGNQAPVFDSVPAPSGTEGTPITGRIRASDPDGGTVTIAVQAGTAPSGFTLADSGNGLATFSYTPLFNAAGTYNIGIIINDGTTSDTSVLTITVADAGNQTPVLTTITNKQVTESKVLSFVASASDADSTIPILSAAPLPAGATFTINPNGTGTFSWTPGSTDSGTYLVSFYATDAAVPSAIDSQAVVIFVKDTNRVPLVGTLPHPSQINEGQTVTINVFSGDPDTDQIPILSAYMSGGGALRPNMTFVDNGNGTGIFTFTPSFQQGDSNQFYYPVFRATDSRVPALFAETGASSNSIRVMNLPQPPNITVSLGNGPFTITEGDSLVFGVLAVDPDGGAVNLTAQNLPFGATFVGVFGNRTFRWLSSFTSAGNYTVRFIAVDPALMADTQNISITVNEAGNQAPIFSTVLPAQISVVVGTPVTTSVKATDPESNPIVLTAIPILTGAAFVDSGTGGGTYFYTPVVADVGTIQQVSFIASDGSRADTVITSYNILASMRGDTDGDLHYTINDVVYLVKYLFRSGPPPNPINAGDVDKSGSANIHDITYLVNYLYKNGPPPPQ
jgi:phage I-like protein